MNPQTIFQNIDTLSHYGYYLSGVLNEAIFSNQISAALETARRRHRPTAKITTTNIDKIITVDGEIRGILELKVVHKNYIHISQSEQEILQTLSEKHSAPALIITKHIPSNKLQVLSLNDPTLRDTKIPLIGKITPSDLITILEGLL
jgi:Holliday junction resolvase